MIVTAGATNVSVYYYVVQDASATSPGEPVTGLLFSDIETGGSASFVRQGAASADLTLITLASADAAHADGGFILVDDTKNPGLYRCDYPDAAFATGIDQVFLQIVVASANNAVAAPILVDMTDVDLRDSVRAGLTALPNADADAAGGLPISDAGGLDLDSRLDADVSSRLAPTVAARTLDVSAGGTAGLDWANVESQGTAVNLSATNFDVDQVIASVSGSVGSVVGNVGGNVAGSVNSVTTAVTVGTNNDKTGYTLSTAGILAIWNQLTSALTTASTIGKLIVDNLNATVSSRATPTQVNAEVLDVFTVDTFAEPTSVPAATATLEDKIGWIAALARNKLTQTATTSLLRNDADSATIGTSTDSDDLTTAIRGKFV